MFRPRGAGSPRPSRPARRPRRPVRGRMKPAPVEPLSPMSAEGPSKADLFRLRADSSASAANVSSGYELKSASPWPCQPPIYGVLCLTMCM